MHSTHVHISLLITLSSSHTYLAGQGLTGLSQALSCNIEDMQLVHEFSYMQWN